VSSKYTAARKTKKNIDTIQIEITQAKLRLFESILCLNDVAMRIENQDHWTLKKEALSGLTHYHCIPLLPLDNHQHQY